MCVENYRNNLKNINQIALYFAEEGPGRGSEGPGRGSEDIKKDCNINCFGFFFFLEGFHDKGVAWLLCPFLL